MALPRTVQGREYDRFFNTSKGNVAVRVGEEATSNNLLAQEITTVGTSSVALTFPEGTTSFTLFHQHDTAKLYFGDSSVSSSGYPYLEKNDSLSLEVKDTIELFAISDTASTEVFILGEVKE